MKYKTCIQLALIIILNFLFSSNSFATEKQTGTQKPNFVIIFTDDQGYADLGCYGAEKFSTPHMDKMAEEGIRFTDFYVPATVCSPSRAALLTGMYPKRVGRHKGVLFPFSDTGLNLEEITIAELLKPMGYQTACIGKWHLGHLPQYMPTKQGFDYYCGIPYSNDMDRYYEKHNFQAPPIPVYRNDSLIQSGVNQDSLTIWWTNEATNFIEQNKDKPFFLYLAHSMPHTPWHVSDRYRGTSELGMYGDIIQELDWSVGEVLKTLKENGLDEKTMIIFTSDNGPANWIKKGGSCQPLRGRKASTWEGGQRVPCIIRWKNKIPEGKTYTQLISSLDFLPTMISFAGGTLPENRVYDGFDISELLLAPESTNTPYEYFYYYSRDGDPEAIRSGDWKLHIAKSVGWDKNAGEFPVSLYNLKMDIGEQNNIADENPDIVEKLKNELGNFDKTLTQKQ